MPKDLLNNPEYFAKKKNPVFSKIAFCFSIVTVTITAYFMIATALKRPVWFSTARFTIINGLLGIAFTIVSLVRKERLRYVKAIGTIVNIAFFLFLLAALISAIIDLY